MLNTFNAEGSLQFLRSIFKKIENKFLHLVAFEKWQKHRIVEKYINIDARVVDFPLNVSTGYSYFSQCC